MADTGKLTLRDIRRAFRLIGRIREVGAEPDQWRPLMLRGLLKLVDAEIAISSEVHATRCTRNGPVRVTDRGWGADRDGHTWRIDDIRSDLAPAELWLAPAGPEPDEQLVPVRPLRPLHAGSCFILSQYPLPHAGAVDQLGLHRTSVDAPFTRREHRLIRLFHVELGRFWRAEALKRASDPAASLPPRLTQTLQGLLSGDSEKQIAVRLELSRHTIHNYVKALHQRFGVSSRGELLAKVNQARDDNAFRPRLSLELPQK